MRVCVCVVVCACVSSPVTFVVRACVRPQRALVLLRDTVSGREPQAAQPGDVEAAKRGHDSDDDHDDDAARRQSMPAARAASTAADADSSSEPEL